MYQIYRIFRIYQLLIYHDKFFAFIAFIALIAWTRNQYRIYCNPIFCIYRIYRNLINRKKHLSNMLSRPKLLTRSIQTGRFIGNWVKCDCAFESLQKCTTTIAIPTIIIMYFFACPLLVYLVPGITKTDICKTVLF